MKKIKILGLFIMVLSLCISLASCDEINNENEQDTNDQNEGSSADAGNQNNSNSSNDNENKNNDSSENESNDIEEQTKDIETIWNEAINPTYNNLTVTVTMNNYNADDYFKGLIGIGIDGISSSQLQVLAGDADLIIKEKFVYKYTDKYYFEESAVSELLNADIDVQIYDAEFPKQYYIDFNASELGSDKYAAGYCNFCYKLDEETFSIVEVQEWNAQRVSFTPVEEHFSNMYEFVKYEYDSIKGCYKYIIERKMMGRDNKEVTYSKTINEVYNRGNHVVKIATYDYLTESYMTVMSIPGALPLEDDNFILTNDTIIEFKNYDSTEIELPDEVKNLNK